MARIFDTTVLRAPVEAAEVRLFRKQALDSAETDWGDPGESSRSVYLRLAAVVLLPPVAGWLAARIFAGSVGVGIGVAGVVLLVVLADCLVAFRRAGALGLALWREQLRCVLFAAANQLRYAPRTEPAGYPGVIFNAGRNRQIRSRIWSESGPFLDCGTQVYVTGAGRDEQLHTWRYADFRLPGALPSLLLNSRADETLPGDLGEFGAPERRQSLGGVMDEHFHLYCRPQHRADAFYVFTPDLLALLIDHARDLDVEIAADWLFVYSRYRLTVSDPETWARLALIQERILPLISARARSFRDFR